MQVDVLLEKGLAYPCFCTDAELEQMKAQSEKLKLPPVYRGKWNKATAEEVQEAKDAGIPFCYRYRVPPGKQVRVPYRCSLFTLWGNCLDARPRTLIEKIFNFLFRRQKMQVLRTALLPCTTAQVGVCTVLLLIVFNFLEKLFVIHLVGKLFRC